jgi:hypothetical protein
MRTWPELDKNMDENMAGTGLEFKPPLCHSAWREQAGVISVGQIAGVRWSDPAMARRASAAVTARLHLKYG